jgi:DNA helicase-2/ATP-dependent DNA helicase PcrA
MSLIRMAPAAFGANGFSIIDREDQVQLFRGIRGRSKLKSVDLPAPAQLCDIYSFVRNTCTSLSKALASNTPEFLEIKKHIAPLMKEYEDKKAERHYLDYDDILNLVAQRLNESPEVRNWVAKKYRHLLVDEMQDTNPLQWALLSPLIDTCKLFCVGDDAQSIYGFRGADFRNVHSFQERVPDAAVMKLTKNYRSTQEIL